MTMQLFSFGHPCEHQLRRTCIGGTSCPLNGYPDNWCCSYIKGKINFKRDKPCEGTRCRWGFTHPSQSQFDAVTLVMNESRPIAVKIDDAEDKDLLTFNIENTHVVDTVQCALHMMRRPPSSCTTRVGQLLAYAAVRTGDSKVFMQLLKTMKKPFDGYLLGAYDYLTSGNLPSATAASASASASSTAAAAAAATAGEKNSKSLTKRGSASAGSIGGGGGEKKDKDKDKDKDSAVDELRNGMVDLMSAALSSGGQLVHRDDQHTLQAVFVQALRGYPKGNRRRQEMLEAAVAKFGARAAAAAAAAGKGAAPPVAGIAAASAAHAAAIAAIAAAQSAHTHSPASHANANANTNANTAAAASPGHNNNNNNSSGAAANATSATNAAASAANSANHAAGGGGSGKKAETAAAAAADDEAAASHTPRSRENSDSATVRGGRAQGTTASTSNARQKEAATPVPHNHIAANNTTTHTTTTTSTTTNSSSNNNNNNNNAHLGNSGGGANAGAAIPVTRTPAAAVVPVKQAPIVGISRVARVQSAHVTRRYDPVRTDLPLPDILLFGGLFGLTQRSAASSLLGNASNRAPPSNASASVAASGDTRSSSAMDSGGNAINDKVFHILHSPEPECNPFLDADAQQLLRGIYED